ncbi:aminotransferase class I/II-fold pyridoxal phosphate-dependent enzyme [Candidatus Laterigemmans baculatus]|uniref:aminotransferase class I/II-fold pyridoxal phosphate-dependent enzyme n=1 Tax=Candidatus Laterigemmans baculatus TaxID=2770505 RepID=UPI001F2A99DE|nr:aminotransferase class I/II-fold pyridoxal phosphate-dependent enzyme [Candidatus Laterigemmans baculatus]
MNLERSLGPYDPPRTNFVEILRYWAEQRPNDFAYRFTDAETRHEQLSYSELLHRVEGLAGYLQREGVGGERVLLFYPPGLDFVVGFYACHAAGAIAVPAFPPRKNRKSTRIRSIAQDAEARFGLSVASVVEQIQANAQQSEELESVRLLATDRPEAFDRSAYRPVRLQSSDIALLQYTSGSTGSPKGVILTHENLVRNCELINYGFETRHNEIGLTWLPTYHDMGLVGGVLNPLFLGTTNVLMSPMTFLQKPIRWLQAITQYKVVISGGPNFGYQLCVDKIEPSEIAQLDLSSWKIAFNGAEPIRERTLRAFAERFAPCGFDAKAFLPCYGMAETTLIVTGGPSETRPVLRDFDKYQLDQGTAVPIGASGPSGESETSGESKSSGAEGERAQEARTLVGCGAVLPGETVRIVDPTTRAPMPGGEIGEIWVQSPCVGRGYWRNPEATHATFEAVTADGDGPFLRTGDLGFLHEGQLFVTGRLKDMIIVRGVNRYPQDIEQTVERASAAVQTGSVAAVSMQDDAHGEQLVIVAETIRRRDLDWDAEITSIRRAVAAEHDLPPDAVYLVRNSSVPKTSSGKIQRHACHQAILENDLRIIASWSRSEQLRIEPDRTGGRFGGGVMQAAAQKASAGSADSSAPHPQVVAAVMQHVREIARERAGDLSPETNIMLDLALDSLERLEIAHALEQTFGGRFPEDILLEIETVNEVAAAIERHMDPQQVQRVIAAAENRGPGSGGGEFRSGAGASAEARLSSGVNGTPSASAAREISPEEFQFEHLPEYRRLKQTMAQVELTGLPNPYFTVHEGTVRDTTRIGGRELISFASYNYLGFSGDPVVVAAAQAAIAQYGTSVSASRLVSGEKPLHGELEREIADFVGVDQALVFVGGHSTNETTIGHLVGPGDLIVHDSLSHNSIVQGAVLSGARRRPFPHNDFRALDALLSEVRGQYRRVLIIVEGTYSMDGDFPQLPEFVRVKQQHKCFLMVDEAHSIGTLGATGRGIAEQFGVNPRDVDIWMGTLSKSFASCGGYIAGSAALVELLRYTAPGFVFSVGMPPSAAAAALAAFRQLRQEPERVQRLRERSEQFLRKAKAAGFDTGESGGTPVIPIITGNSLLALRLSHRLFQEGINVQPILYPAVEEAAARLRFFITATHTAKQIDKTIAALARHGADLGLVSQDRSSADRSAANVG